MHPIVFNLLLFVGGAVTGSFVNWAIYNLCFEDRAPISPWSSPGDKASKRRWQDYIPILGWFQLSRDDSFHGKFHWLRPMLIELSMAAGAVWFYQWTMSGGLISGQTVLNPISPEVYEIWFSGHALLITLMMIATFIDFDEKSIPDWITVPGTVVALLFAAFRPDFRLPEVVNNQGGMGKLVHWITFHSNSLEPFPSWHHDWRGFLVVFVTLGIWAFVLLTTTPYLYQLWKVLRRARKGRLGLTWMFLLQTKRKTKCRIRVSDRESTIPNLLTMGTIVLALWAIAAYVFVMPDLSHWDSFFGAVVGLGFGGGMVWMIRIVGGYALGEEAMGFGDVTLMAMIGAFLGWQAALLTFAFAPFAALFIALAQLIILRKNDIAFGPYLCLAALFLILFWDPIWTRMRFSLFSWGSWLFILLFGALILFGIMLGGIQMFKSRYGSEEVLENS